MATQETHATTQSPTETGAETPTIQATAEVVTKATTPTTETEQLPALVKGVMDDDPAAQKECTEKIRGLLSPNEDSLHHEVIDSGVVPRFVEFLGCDGDPALQSEAAKVLAGIAAGTSHHTKAAAQANSVPALIRLLSSPNDDAREQAAHALGNIADDSPSCRDLVLQSGVIQPLLQRLHENSDLSMLRVGARTLSKLCGGKPQPKLEMVKSALPTLARLIISNRDEEVLADACEALSCLCDDPDEQIQAVLDTGVCPHLVSVLSSDPAPAVRAPALRAISNIASGNDQQTQAVVDSGALPCLLAFLSNPEKATRKSACLAISNIAGGNKEQLRALFENNIIPPIIQLMTNDEDCTVRKEAVWTIANATSSGGPDEIKFLVEQRCIPPLCQSLSVDDVRIISIALGTLEKILKIGQEDANRSGNFNQMAAIVEQADGFSKIEELQQLPNNDVSEKSTRILESCFGDSTVPPPSTEDETPTEVSSTAPPQLVCPMTHGLMNDPVVAEDGHTYERAAISRYFRSCAANGKTLTSPMTRGVLQSNLLVPNVAIRSLCREHQESAQPATTSAENSNQEPNPAI